MVEKKDAHFSFTVYAIAALLVMLIAGVIFVRTVYQRPLATETERQQAAKKVTFPQPQPGHFSSESLVKLRAKEASELQAYGWANDAHSEAKVPVDRAIELYEAHRAD